MEKQTKLLLILALIFILGTSVSATTFESWANGWIGTDGDWSNSGNWDKGVVPAYADGRVVQIIGNSSGPVICNGVNAGFHKMQVGTTTDGPNPGAMTVQAGGTLQGRWYILVGDATGTNGQFDNAGSVVVEDWVGVGRTGTGVFNNTGSLDITGFLTIGTNGGGNGTFNNTGTLTTGTNLVVGQSGTGVFNMDSGTININGSISLPGSSGNGTFNLNDGTVNVASASGFNIGGTSGVLNMYDGQLNVAGRLNMWSAGAEFNLIGGVAIFDNILGSTFANYGNIDITGGTLLLAGDLTADADLLSYLNNNQIYTSIEGQSIGMDLVNISGETYTQLTMIPEPATLVLLSIGSFFCVRRKK